MSRRQWAFSVLGMLTVAALVPAAPAQAGTEYLHASSCQELGNGESGAINRSFYRITNVGYTVKEVICPIPVDRTSRFVRMLQPWRGAPPVVRKTARTRSC